MKKPWSVNMTKYYSTYECLESVDTMIKDNETQQNDLLWDTEVFDPRTSRLLDRIQGDLDRLYQLRADGVLYEPLF